MRMKIILRNDFHKTETVVIANIYGGQHELVAEISDRQARDARRALCGIAGCTCSGEIGIRGNACNTVSLLSSRGINLHQYTSITVRIFKSNSKPCEKIHKV